jgi:fumarylpyruvate hydrolase
MDFSVSPLITQVPVEGKAPFCVRRIFCVGRNYADHAREMGSNPDREPPFFFTKPADAIVLNGGAVPYPPATHNFHHEVELVVAIGVGGRDIPVEQAAAHIFGYAVGLDMTRRDLQSVARESGQPWDMSKGFDHSAPISAISPKEETGLLQAGFIRLKVNGSVRQEGDLNQMIWSIPEVIANLSGLVTLAAGDLIYTGTPAGVSAVVAGDHLEASVAGLPILNIKIVDLS